MSRPGQRSPNGSTSRYLNAGELWTILSVSAAIHSNFCYAIVHIEGWMSAIHTDMFCGRCELYSGCDWWKCIFVRFSNKSAQYWVGEVWQCVCSVATVKTYPTIPHIVWSSYYLLSISSPECNSQPPSGTLPNIKCHRHRVEDKIFFSHMIGHHFRYNKQYQKFRLETFWTLHRPPNVSTFSYLKAQWTNKKFLSLMQLFLYFLIL